MSHAPFDSHAFRIAQLESLACHLSEIELTLTADGKIVGANERALATYGYPRETFIGMNIISLRVKPESALVASQLNMALTTDHLVFESRHLRSNGTSFPVEVNARHFRFEGQDYLHSIVADISERKKIEGELRRNRQLLAQVVEDTEMGLWDWYVQTGDLYVNEIWEKMLGYTAKELHPTSIDTWMHLIHPDDLETAYQLREAQFTKRDSDYSCEVRMRHKDGNWIWVWDRGQVVDWAANGQPLRMSGTQEDITGRKEQEIRMSSMLKAILAQNDLKERLFTILAHDLRGPVGNLNGLLGLAIEGQLSVGELQEALPNLKHAAESAYNLLENILQWVRSSMDEIRVLQERIVVDNLLNSVYQWLEPAAKSKSIELKLELAPQLSVFSDVRMSETILRNIVSNAIKFTPPGGHVCIRSRERSIDLEICIEVEDQGPGIASDILERIKRREPNKRVSGTAGESGSGLGLMFCQEMAGKMGIRIEIDSVEGQGSCFRMVYPDVLDGEL